MDFLRDSSSFNILNDIFKLVDLPRASIITPDPLQRRDSSEVSIEICAMDFSRVSHNISPEVPYKEFRRLHVYFFWEKFFEKYLKDAQETLSKLTGIS